MTDLTDAHWTMPATCGCGDPDCDRLAFGYPFCSGCGEHHRLPIALGPDEPCPVDRLTSDEGER